MAEKNYTLQILRKEDVCLNRDDAIDFLNRFEKHKIGQIIEVMYWGDDGTRKAIVAIGVMDWDDNAVNGRRTVNPSVGNSDPTGNIDDIYYEIIADSGSSGCCPIVPEIEKTSTKINLGGAVFEVANWQHGSTLTEQVTDALEFQDLNNIQPPQPTQIETKHPNQILKDFEGSIQYFQSFLYNLDNSQIEYERLLADEIKKSVVFIHDNNVGTHIFANGVYYELGKGGGGTGGFDRTMIINKTNVPNFAATNNDYPVIGDPFEWRNLNGII